MKKFLKIFLGILFLALLVGTFVFLWNKTRPVKVVYTLATPVHDTIRQYVIASGKVEPRDEVLVLLCNQNLSLRNNPEIFLFCNKYLLYLSTENSVNRSLKTRSL